MIQLHQEYFTFRIRDGSGILFWNEVAERSGADRVTKKIQRTARPSEELEARRSKRRKLPSEDMPKKIKASKMFRSFYCYSLNSNFTLKNRPVNRTGTG